MMHGMSRKQRSHSQQGHTKTNADGVFTTFVIYCRHISVSVSAVCERETGLHRVHHSLHLMVFLLHSFTNGPLKVLVTMTQNYHGFSLNYYLHFTYRYALY